MRLPDGWRSGQGKSPGRAQSVVLAHPERSTLAAKPINAAFACASAAAVILSRSVCDEDDLSALTKNDIATTAMTNSISIAATPLWRGRERHGWR